MRPAYDRWCAACETFTLAVIHSRAGKLGRSRTRRCLNCKAEKRTIETEVVPGLRRAIRKLRRAMGEQLPLPL